MGTWLSIVRGDGTSSIENSHGTSPINNSHGTSPIENDSRKQARVAKLKICRNSACSFPTSPHLVVDLIDVPLHRNNATAISYVWGEFDRQKRAVGHTFQPAKHVQLELGKEWVVPDVVDRLAELSEEKPVWMDQLCIPQEEDEIVKTLADIPSIYRTLDVVILLPGSLSGCIPKLVEELNLLPSDDQGRKIPGQIEECLSRQHKCLSLGGSSWSLRMWPRQEFMNSQRVRCVWASKIRNPCAILDDPGINVETLPPFQRNMFDMLTGDFSQTTALRFIHEYLQITHTIMAQDLFHYLSSSSHGREVEQYSRFLLGEQFIKPNNSDSNVLPVIEFLSRLSREAGGERGGRRTRREATKARDYIVSVWAACPDYNVPKAYKSMSVAELMQDAIDQLQCKHGMTIAVTAPQGLFDSESAGSASWNPLKYLSEIHPSSDVDLYRVLTTEGLALPVLRGKQSLVPVVLHDTAQFSLSPSAMSYEMLVKHFQEAFSHENESSSDPSNRIVSRMVIKLLHRIMSHWEDNRAQAVHYAIVGVSRNHYPMMFSRQSLFENRTAMRYLTTIYPIKKHMDFLWKHRMRAGFDEDEAYSQELDALIDSSDPKKIYNAVYNVVAAALELDLEYCEKKNVQLIFSSIDNDERRPPRVGFCRGDVDIWDIASGKRKTITVSIGGYNNRPSTLLYEAVYAKDVETRFEEEGFKNIRITPAYQVFAVWVPIESVFDGKYGAYARWPHNFLPEENVGVLL